MIESTIRRGQDSSDPALLGSRMETDKEGIRRKMMRHNVLRFFALWLGVMIGYENPVQGQDPVCGDYDGCDPVILKVRGTVGDMVGTPIVGAQITATENRRRNVNSIEFFNHCGEGLHRASEVTSGTSASAAGDNAGSYELLFVVCADDSNDFAADFDICVEASGLQSTCLTATFDGDDDRDEIVFNLPSSSKNPGPIGTELLDVKNLPEGDCGDYDDCSMTLLKVRGRVQDSGGAPIVNAEVTGVLTQSNDVNAVQFYSHCSDGFHSLNLEGISSSTSGSSAEAGFYELLFAVCGEDNNDVLPDEFDADFEITASAPGFESQTTTASFDEEDDRDDRDFTLVGGVVQPTATPTESPTATPTVGPSEIPTALNPAADVDGSGRIDHEDLLEVLNNWFRMVE